MKLSKADAKTLVTLLFKADKDVTFDSYGYIRAMSGRSGDAMYFDIQHLDVDELNEIRELIDDINNTDINQALSDLKSALKDGIDKLEEYDNR